MLLATAGLVLPISAQTPCFESSFGTNLALTDDSTATNLALGFSFPLGAQTFTSISVSSNGFVWMGNNSDSACCSGDVTAFLSNQARIAVLWTDLNPGASGSVHFNALPNRAVITWNQVPEFGGSTNFTCQIQLESNGSITMFWDGSVSIDGRTTLIGVTPGGGAANPGGRNLSNVPFTTTVPTVYELFAAGTFDLRGAVIQFVRSGSGYAVSARTGCGIASFRAYGSGCPASTPLGLTDGGNRPSIGTTFNMVFGEALPSATAAFGMLGATQNAAGLPLDSIGMVGCRLYLSLDVFQSVPLLGRYSVFSLAIPNRVDLLGALLYAQTGTLAPGANPAGVTVSNGGLIEIGN